MYEWREWEDDGQKYRGLLPIDEPNNYSLRRIASIYRRGDGMYVGAYYWKGTGHLEEGGGVYKTVRGAMRSIERHLASFWEVPVIRNPVLA